MCGGAIISDYEPVGNLYRKLSARDLWAELDPISSDYWSSSSSSSINAGKADSAHSPTHSVDKPKKSDSGKSNQPEKENCSHEVKITRVIWTKPNIGVVKLNTDGSALQNSGRVGAGGLFYSQSSSSEPLPNNSETSSATISTGKLMVWKISLLSSVTIKTPSFIYTMQKLPSEARGYMGTDKMEMPIFRRRNTKKIIQPHNFVQPHTA